MLFDIGDVLSVFGAELLRDLLFFDLLDFEPVVIALLFAVDESGLIVFPIGSGVAVPVAVESGIVVGGVCTGGVVGAVVVGGVPAGGMVCPGAGVVCATAMPDTPIKAAAAIMVIFTISLLKFQPNMAEVKRPTPWKAEGISIYRGFATICPSRPFCAQ